MTMAKDMTVEVRETAKPVWETRVLKIIPTDSPHEMMAKELKATTKKRETVRGRPAARTVRTAQRRPVRTSKGNSARVYWRKKASIE